MRSATLFRVSSASYRVDDRTGRARGVTPELRTSDVYPQSCSINIESVLIPIQCDDEHLGIQ